MELPTALLLESRDPRAQATIWTLSPSTGRGSRDDVRKHRISRKVNIAAEQGVIAEMIDGCGFLVTTRSNPASPMRSPAHNGG